jgi:DNA polymerase-3 subunit delta
MGALLDACLTPPFLTDRRVVLARNAGVLNADDGARLVQYLGDPLDTTVLVLVGGGGTVPAKLVTAVKAKGELIDAGLPRQARERTSWLVDKLKAAPVKLDNRAAQRLGDHLGEDLSRLNGILEVLSAAYGEGASVSVDQLEPFLGDAGGVAPWDLTDALDKGDAPTALGLLHRLIKGGDRHPLVVMATLHRHYGQMLRLDGSGARDEKAAAQLLGLKGSTFPAKKALTSARKLGSPKIRRAVALLAEADLDLRGQKSWPEELVMEVLIARLCQLAR